jgi:hypothetical protein
MKSYIITRFSIFDINHKKFELNKNRTKKAYMNKLFSPKRLGFKFEVFEKMTLPSVLKQTNTNWEWIIFTSSYLPEEYKKKILDLISPHKQITCKFIESFKEFNFEPKNKEEKFCTLRLDDDDGLAPTFLEKLQIFESKKGSIVTTIRGIKFALDKNKEIIYGCKTSLFCIALGLCAIGMNIYDCGNHTKLKEKYPIKVIRDPDMYYLCSSSNFCDKGRDLNNNDVNY